MSTELGMELRSESVSVCHRMYPGSRERFIQCLCENVVGLCRTASSHLPPTSVTATTPTGTLTPPLSTSTTPLVPPNDWTRSYSVTAGLCALFLVMCVVIIVLRIMSKRNEPQTRSRVSVSTVPVRDSDPPPYEIVVRLPPSYISREPPPYCEIDIDKYPSPLICPRQPGNGRTTAVTSDPETAAPSGETANCAGEAVNRAGETANCGEEASRSHGEAPATSREAASADSAVGDTDLAAASTSSVSSCVAEVMVISEVEDSLAASARSSESASR